MKNSQTLTLSNNKYTFNILNSIEVKVEITENPYQLKIEDLFTMAARINKMRSFLFVSRVLGKHIPINPNKGLLTGALLAARFIEKVKADSCPETERLLSLFLEDHSDCPSNPFVSSEINPIIIGFAETATALGHSFFACFKNADYFHTTREIISEKHAVITFEEEHSHATSHRCYIHKELLDNNREIILVDDEMTTGKTALNIIRSLHAQFPRQDYTVVSILDWRSEENKQNFDELEKELGINIHEVCLVAGKVKIDEKREIDELKAEVNRNLGTEDLVESIDLSSLFENQGSYIKETGRFGLTSLSNQAVSERLSAAAAILSKMRTGNQTLCLGTGELMYIPMKIAAGMGRGISYQSTTRSPIYVRDTDSYGARYGAAFPNPEDLNVTNYVYNIPPNFYDELFVFFEKEMERDHLIPFLNEMEQYHFKSIKLVFLTKG